MTRRQWIGFIVFPAAIAGLLAFLFFVAKIDVFRQRTAEEAVAELTGGAKDPKVRLQAATRLMALCRGGKLAAEQAVPALRKGLEDPSIEVRLASAEALAAVQGAESAPTLEPLLADQSHDVRRIAAFLLGSVKAPGARPALREALKDAWEPVRWNVAVALARLGDASGRDVLHDMLQAPAPRSAKKAIGYLLPTGEALTVEPGRAERQNALFALVYVGDAGSIGAIRRFQEAAVDPDLSALADKTITAIQKRLGDERATSSPVNARHPLKTNARHP